MEWHIEHHMFAGVPCYRLKRLREEIADDLPEPRSHLGAWREMRAIGKRQRTQPGYQFDTPLPSTATPAVVSQSAVRVLPGDADELAASIGALDPDDIRAEVLLGPSVAPGR